LKNFFAALKTRHFLKHLGFASLTFLILVFTIKWGLKSYTHHDESFRVDVPNLIGLKTSQIEEALSPLELEYIITDSVFSDKGAKGTVLLQNPGPTKITKQKVKKGRKIYITVVSPMAKLITVPKLVNKSRRHAEGVLKIIGLKAKIKYRPYNDCNDCVIEQLYKNKPLKEGGKVPKGETITLILGQKSGETVPVIDLMGLTIEEAEKRLSNSSLTMFMTCDCKTKKDSASAIIYRQSPAEGDVSAGTEISVWLTNDKTLLNK
jgi:eukaryotic-like serine/threonine-protein kinase